MGQIRKSTHAHNTYRHYNYPKLASAKGNKVMAQAMATALAVYVTDSDLAGNLGTAYGFNVSTGGTGEKTHNVGGYGAAIGLANGASYPVAGLRLPANLQKQLGSFNADAFSRIFAEINVSGSRY